jgi:F420-dependent oxidoreductase-like protein
MERSDMEAALQVLDFTWPRGTVHLADDMVRIAQACEAAEFVGLSVMDHFWQLPHIGPPEHDVPDAYTLLGFLAAHTKRVLLHTMVTNVVAHEPGPLAKKVSTLDVLSGGRAALGIGAGWGRDEAEGLGVPFPPTAERFDRLEETIQICLRMWSSSEEPYEGKVFQLARPLNAPQPLTKPRPKLIIGGSGEQRTLRLVARYADACNILNGPEMARKLDVLRGHCDSEGRDYGEVQKTAGMILTNHVNPDELLAELRTMHELGITLAYLMVPGLPLEGIEVIGEHVIPEISKW